MRAGKKPTFLFIEPDFNIRYKFAHLYKQKGLFPRSHYAIKDDICTNFRYEKSYKLKKVQEVNKSDPNQPELWYHCFEW